MQQTSSKGHVALAGALLLCVLSVTAAWAQPPTAGSPWYRTLAGGDTEIELYFFWSQHCPHCNEARPFIERLPRELPWVALRSFEVSSSEQNARLYVDLARSLGQEASAVPGFLFCGEMHVGYESDATTGAMLRARLLECRQRLTSGAAPPARAGSGAAVAIPLLGRIDPQGASLPLVTVILAGLDAFNPCAFFVLLFLLSLMVHARSRARMALVGGVFVLFSGLIYFVFMAAWLNVFLWLGELRVITFLAGLTAVTMGVLNIKDYVWFGRGPSLSIPEHAKPGLFARMRGLVGTTALAPMLAGTVVLAIAANSYELLCTAGFPMVYTRILTLNTLPTAAYYGYLALYNIIYVIPLAIIVAVFTVTLGSRKLSEREGRVLKLLSGTMMFGLGALLLIAPQWLQDARISIAVLLVAVALTVLVDAMARHRAPR